MTSELDNPQAGRSKSGGSGFWMALLALSVIVFGANMGLASWQGNRYAGANADTADLQVLSQQFADRGKMSVSTGTADTFNTFRMTRGQIDAKLQSLQKTFGDKAGVGDALRRLNETWKSLDPSANRVLESEVAVTALAENADRFVERVSQLQGQLNEIVRALTTGGGSQTVQASQIYIVLQQSAVAGTMAREVSRIRAGGANSEEASETLARDALTLGQVLEGLQEGNQDLGVAAIHNNVAGVSALKQAQEQWQQMRQNLDAVLENSKGLAEAQAAAAELSMGTGQMLGDSRQVFDALTAFGSTHDARLFPNFWVGVASGAVVLLSIFGLAVSMRRSRSRDQELYDQTQHEYNSRNQQAIMRLLDEITPLADGDLTVKASVTEDMTGAIADAVNYAVEDLRNLVTTISDTSVQVAASSQETQATAMQLAEASNHQAEQISAASERINEIATSIQKVSRNSSESAEVAQRSVLIAAEGAGVVRQTIRGMDQIRGQIQETSKRIKRLGESTQEIGSIVELINDISEQTNILALNAAVQAASAGEAGRGFAVVADEVQRLAERTSGATQRIEGLVQTIQADTNEAVNSMEQTTAEVVSGARLAEDAGTALAEIERVSNDLNELIKNISSASGQQSTAAADITRTMELIRQITAQTSQGAGQTAESIGHLVQLAADLRNSVAGFKLPES
ncbi:MAG: methyl-accepting chemotaxis protein [Xanthomonadaceae bacterium]|jgi:twitching motility protein PilJ|nr:methyl-accepting chemotaxis protein [Xanthomonadaceae bacterium]